MAKIAQILLSLLFGILLGAGVVGAAWYRWLSEPSELWTVSEPLTLENGSILPVGTDLILHRYMPEGFATLKLYVNVEGEELDSFKISADEPPQLVVPHWASK